MCMSEYYELQYRLYFDLTTSYARVASILQELYSFAKVLAKDFEVFIWTG
jgi:hypothetical protein